MKNFEMPVIEVVKFETAQVMNSSWVSDGTDLPWQE